MDSVGAAGVDSVGAAGVDSVAGGHGVDP